MRRVMTCLVGMTVLLLSQGKALGGDWPQFLGPDRNGVSQETGLIDRLDANSLKVRWRKPTGDGFSGPIVVGETVYLFEQRSPEAILRALSVKDGSQQWQSSYPCRFIGGIAGGGPGPRATPIAHGSQIYTYGPNAVLRCHELATGDVVWSRDLKKEFDIPDNSFFGTSSTPVVYGNLLIVNVGGRKAGIVALETDTGKTVWTSTNDEASYASPVVAAARGKDRLFVFARTGLYCLDPLSGKEHFFFRWRARINASVNAATPVLAGDKVFVTSSYNTGGALLSVTDEGYDNLWSGPDHVASQYNTPVIDNGYLYAIDGRADAGLADLCCVDLKTGKKVWIERGYGCASLLAVDGKLLLFSDQGVLELAVLSPQGFRSLGKVTVTEGTDTRAHPALANGLLFIRGSDELVCIDVRK